MTAAPTAYREADGSEVTLSHAKEAWAASARVVLEQVAGEYHGLTNQRDLAAELQRRSGITTSATPRSWLGDVLDLVARGCHSRGEPLLSALCVRADGTIGDAYGVAMADAYGSPVPADLDLAAAEERLKCYRHFGATMPRDGGHAVFAPQLAVRRRNAARRLREDTPLPVCPTCHLALPRTGQCDTCA
jgi:hypothetical protein